MDRSKKWYAVYTRTGCERKVTENLSRKNIESYCPFDKISCKENGGKITVHQPLFVSYVFVRLYESELPLLKNIPGIISFLYWLDKPAVVSDAEIEIIKKTLKEYTNIKLERTFQESLIKHPVQLFSINNSLKIMLPSLGYILTAETAPVNERAPVRNMLDQANLPYPEYALVNKPAN